MILATLLSFDYLFCFEKKNLRTMTLDDVGIICIWWTWKLLDIIEQSVKKVSLNFGGDFVQRLGPKIQLQTNLCYQPELEFMKKNYIISLPKCRMVDWNYYKARISCETRLFQNVKRIKCKVGEIMTKL